MTALDDIKPDSDLFGLRRSLSGGLGVETAAIRMIRAHGEATVAS
jgi:hypothetical protein